MPDVLIVGSDAALRDTLLGCIREAGWGAAAVASAEPPRRERPSVVVIDLAGAACIRTVEAYARDGATVVALGAAEPRRLAIDALRAGAREFLRKPFELRALERALAAAEYGLRGSPARLAREWAGARRAGFRRDVEAAARSDATLQIVGERGTGRHRVARFVHALSRREGPFVTLGRAEPSSLRLERSGASRAATAIAAAAGGTLLVEEPAAFAAGEQAELLDALARDPASTARATLRMIVICEGPLRAEPRLRAELRFRLDVLLLALPPLRERPADVEFLARDLAERAAIARGVAPPRFPRAAIAALQALPLRGNGPELASLMERAVALFSGRELDVASLLRGRSDAIRPGDDAGTLDLGALERTAIERALVQCRGNRTHAARALGISVRTLRNKLRSYAAAAGSSSS